MHKFFYSKLAIINMKKNAKFYFPYLITSIGTVAMFYIMTMIATHPSLDQMPGADILRSLMVMGSVIIGIFASNLIFYTNKFLMRRRHKEIGLYNILGMEKRHIARILFHEAFFSLIISLVFGILGGILLGRLMMLVLTKVVSFKTVITPYISKIGIIATIILFGVIFLLCLLVNLAKIKLAKPIELLKGSSVGEKEPKTKWFLSLIGFLCIGAGYYIAITTKSPLSALLLFFLAVLLVIIGTFCLFTSGSVLILKLLRKNKKFYYKTNHFTAVSGMIYRMKQNAVGLANICILSTMVLVMVSGTVSLYIGVEDVLSNQFPNDIKVRCNYEDLDEFDSELILSTVNGTLEASNTKVDTFDHYNYLLFSAKVERNQISFSSDNSIDSSNVQELVFLSLDDYNRLTKQNVSLSEGELLVYHKDEKFDDDIELFGTPYRVKKDLKQFPIQSEDDIIAPNVHYIVVPKETDLEWLNQQQKLAYKSQASVFKFFVTIDLEGNKEEKIDLFNKVEAAFDQLKASGAYKENTIKWIYCESRQKSEDMGYSMFGGFLFLGCFLGLLFLMATVQIMYYKQISEGYEDKERFNIMQKVGMSRAEVRKSIRSQVLMVFFVPLVTAAIHVAAAFPMITKMFEALNLTDVPLFFTCTCCTVVVFAFIYAAVYAITARTYYKIVGE